MFDLKDLEYIAAISKAGGVKKAADAVGISQPALTKRMQNLEDKLNLRLFDRQAKGMKLTQAGELFLSESQKLLVHSQDLERRMANHRHGKGGSISIGVKPGLEDAFFRRSLVEFAEAYPETSFRISIDATPTLSEKLRDGRIDFAIGALGYADEHGNELVLSSELEFQPLFLVPILLFARKGHPIFSPTATKMTPFDYPFTSPAPPLNIINKLKAIYKENNSPYSLPHIQVDDYSLIADLVERTDMWSATFNSSHNKILQSDKFEYMASPEFLPPLTIGLVTRKTWSINPNAENLIKIMKKHAAEWII